MAALVYAYQIAKKIGYAQALGKKRGRGEKRKKRGRNPFIFLSLKIYAYVGWVDVGNPKKNLYF